MIELTEEKIKDFQLAVAQVAIEHKMNMIEGAPIMVHFGIYCFYRILKNRGFPNHEILKHINELANIGINSARESIENEEIAEIDKE